MTRRVVHCCLSSAEGIVPVTNVINLGHNEAAACFNPFSKL